MNETAIRLEERCNRLSLRKGADEGNVESVMAEDGTVIGIKRQGLLFLPDGNLPEKYKHAGFNRIYLYCCYQKEEKSSKKQED